MVDAEYKNNSVNDVEVTPEEPAVSATEEVAAADGAASAKPGFGAKVKEWLRKKIVTLKRKTYTIPLLFTLITSFVFLCMIGKFSQLIQENSGIPSLGLCMFVNTLASILVLPLFLNAFPKRKPQNIVYTVLVFVVYALMIVMDVVFTVNLKNFFAENALDVTNEFYTGSINNMTVHIVLVAICAVLFATLPLYKMAINKINTKKVVESNVFSGEIDTEEDV